MITNFITLNIRIAPPPPPLPSCSVLAYDGIIQNIKIKITFKPGFIKCEDVNIILFQKERYFHVLISAAASI